VNWPTADAAVDYKHKTADKYLMSTSNCFIKFYKHHGMDHHAMQHHPASVTSIWLFLGQQKFTDCFTKYSS